MFGFTSIEHFQRSISPINRILDQNYHRIIIYRFNDYYLTTLLARYIRNDKVDVDDVDRICSQLQTKATAHTLKQLTTYKRIYRPIDP